MSTIAVDSIEAKTSGGAVSFPNKPMLKVGQSGNIALSGTSGKIPYNSFSSADVFGGEDNMNAFDTSTSTYTIPTGCSGLWYISAGLYSTSNNPNQLAVNVNGTREDALGSDNGASNMNQGSITKRLNEGDTIQIHAFYASAITSGGNKYHTWWQMNFIG